MAAIIAFVTLLTMTMRNIIDKWEPIWLSGWINGKHSVRLELIDKDGKPVDNGGYNTTTREITVAK